MDEKQVSDHRGHGLQGPHQESGLGFTPLRLRLKSGERFDIIRSRAVVGRRSDSDIRLAFAEVSRQHCQLVYEMGQWRVYDLDSLNGVFVNGERVVEAALYAGDHLSLGTLDLLVEMGTQVQKVIKKIAEILPSE